MKCSWYWNGDCVPLVQKAFVSSEALEGVVEIQILGILILNFNIVLRRVRNSFFTSLSSSCSCHFCFRKRSASALSYIWSFRPAIWLSNWVYYLGNKFLNYIYARSIVEIFSERKSYPILSWNCCPLTRSQACYLPQNFRVCDYIAVRENQSLFHRTAMSMPYGTLLKRYQQNIYCTLADFRIRSNIVFIGS